MIARLQSVLEHTDPLLHPFLQAEDETEAQDQLSGLIAQQVQPLAREIARSRLDYGSTNGNYFQDSEDVCGDVVLQLLHRLREVRSNPEAATISTLRGYVATVTYNSCAQNLRRKYPERQRLKNRLRYVLNHDSRLRMWEAGNGKIVAGLADWKDEMPPQQPRLDASPSDGDLLPGLRELPIRELLFTLFSHRGKPIELEELVAMVAKLWGIQDLQRVEASKNGDAMENVDLWNCIPDCKTDPADVVERRLFLSALWKEICQLRPLQRTALLLNLRDTHGQDMLPMFMLTEATRFSELAASLGMQSQELSELWDRLPLDDATIAMRIGRYQTTGHQPPQVGA